MLKLMKPPALAMTLALATGTAYAADTNGATVPATGAPVPTTQIARNTQDSETTFTEQKKAAEETFESWVTQIGEYAETANENAQDAAETAGESLDEAWADVRASWEDAKDASEDNWEAAKQKFDQSIERLEAAWGELKGG